MVYGYTGKFLRINLTAGTVKVEKFDEKLYKKFIGGRNMAAYIMLKEIPADCDPLGPENKFIITTSLLTGTTIPGASRHTAAAKSPLTDGYGDSEAGGWFAPELKFAGFDGIIVEGVSPKPCYINIIDDKVEIRDASHLWGKDTADVQTLIRNENNDKKTRVLQTGKAGENLVRFAAITNELHHWNGRCGLGAVMGSKKLRAIAVRGSGKPNIYNKEALMEINRWFAKNVFANAGVKAFGESGTSLGVMALDGLGLLPTENFRKGHFEKAAEISAEKMNSNYLVKREGCYGCPIRCKRVVEVNDDEIQVDPEYGGPEYESIGALGSGCDVDDFRYISKANELCARYGMDTISAGFTISFAMECFDKGLLTLEDTNGIDLSFGSKKSQLKILEMIASREGIGDILAEGSYRAGIKIGNGAEKYSMSCRRQEFAAHEPRGKWNIGLGYAVGPTGADHLVVAHDHAFTSKPNMDEEIGDMDLEALMEFGISEPIELLSLSPKKLRMFKTLQCLWSLTNSLDICNFVVIPERKAFRPKHISAMIKAITGWDISTFELIQIGERGIQMSRLFNVRSGCGKEWDKLPDRMFEPIQNGAIKGTSMDRAEFEKAIKIYYEMMGWNKDGEPTEGCLAAVDLDDLF